MQTQNLKQICIHTSWCGKI